MDLATEKSATKDESSLYVFNDGSSICFFWFGSLLLAMDVLGRSSSNSYDKDVAGVIFLKMLVLNVVFIYFPSCYLSVGETSDSISSPMRWT